MHQCPQSKVEKISGTVVNVAVDSDQCGLTGIEKRTAGKTTGAGSDIYMWLLYGYAARKSGKRCLCDFSFAIVVWWKNLESEERWVGNKKKWVGRMVWVAMVACERDEPYRIHNYS